MAKLKDKEIKLNDVKDFLQEDVDFSFEMKVLNKLVKLGYSCAHSGTYIDPVSKINRKFDIRANISNKNHKLSLAIQCKNIPSDSPLIASCVIRKKHEAFHDLVVHNLDIGDGSADPISRPKKIRIEGDESIYKPEELVAKKIDQIGRNSSGDIVVSDNSVFEKMSEVLHSSYDLVESAVFSKTPNSVTAIIPLVIIPDSRLWTVCYDETGQQLGAPCLTASCQLFAGQSWKVDQTREPLWYTFSHLGITTFSYLENTLKAINSNDGVFKHMTDILE